MLCLVDGRPIFYIGKINGIGYTTDEEKEDIVKDLKEENPNIEIVDEVIEIDNDIKNRALELGELQLTYSKSEFMDYLYGKKDISILKVRELEFENKKLENDLSIMQEALLDLQKQLIIKEM